MTSLSDEARAVLAVLADAQGRVVGREELGRRAGLGPRAGRRVDGLLVEVRRALGAEAVRNVRRRGWRLDTVETKRSQIGHGHDASPPYGPLT